MLKNPETPRGVNTYMYMYHVYTSLADAMPAFSSYFFNPQSTVKI